MTAKGSSVDSCNVFLPITVDLRTCYVLRFHGARFHQEGLPSRDQSTLGSSRVSAAVQLHDRIKLAVGRHAVLVTVRLHAVRDGTGCARSGTQQSFLCHRKKKKKKKEDCETNSDIKINK